MNYSQRLGRCAEDLAAKYLVSIGWRILSRNVRNKYGELDITASDLKSKEIVIVEVKCRTRSKINKASESIDGRKMRALIRASYEYIENIGWEGFWRIDLIAVTIDKRGSLEDWTLEHLKNITA